MNLEHLNILCELYKFGPVIELPHKVSGGLLHKMWKISDDKSSYAIKQLSSEIDLGNPRIIDNYNASEEIAYLFKKENIPSVNALRVNDKYLSVIDNIGYLIYPWINGEVLPLNTMSEYHALKISEILAKMHSINLKAPVIPHYESNLVTEKEVFEIVNKAIKYKLPFEDILKKYKNYLLSIVDSINESALILKNHVVISHRDLDQKNVLWDKNDNPILIDWESAALINPTYEIVNLSLDWSGINNNFNEKLFHNIIENYKRSGVVINNIDYRASFYAVQNNWLNWLAFNVERSCNASNPEQKAMGKEQVIQTLLTINNVKEVIRSFKI